MIFQEDLGDKVLKKVLYVLQMKTKMLIVKKFFKFFLNIMDQHLPLHLLFLNNIKGYMEFNQKK